MSSIDTKELIKKPYEETASKSAEIVATMVSELQAKGLVITEEMVRDIIAPKMNEVFKLAYTFGVDMGSQFTIKKINEEIDKHLSNCDKSISDFLHTILVTLSTKDKDEKHS